jgi:hypothetical protein
VAVVFFADDFFRSPFCRDELKLAINSAPRYLPVFWTLTVDVVREKVAAVFSREDPQVAAAFVKEVRCSNPPWGTLLTCRCRSSGHGLALRCRSTNPHPVCTCAWFHAQATQTDEVLGIDVEVGRERIDNALARICAKVVDIIKPPTPQQPRAVPHSSARALQQLNSPQLQLYSGCSEPPVVVLTVAGLLPGAADQAAVAMPLALGHPVAVLRDCLRLMFTAGGAAAAAPSQLLRAVQHMAGELGPGGGGTRVVAACTGGGLVAWCQKGYGAWLPPPAAGAPQLEGVQPCILAVAGSEASGGAPLLFLLGSGLAGQRLLVQQGTELHAARLAARGIGDGLFQTPVPAKALRSEGLLSLAVAADEFFVSAAHPLLVLDASAGVVDALNDM